MAVFNSQDNTNVPFIHTENSLVKNGIIAQDAQRAEDLLQYTVMAYDADNENWTPFNALGQLHGISIPQGIYLGADIPAADLVEGEIEDCEILVGNAIVNVDMVVWDQDLLTAATEIGLLITAETCLRTFGIFLEDVEAISDYDL